MIEVSLDKLDPSKVKLYGNLAKSVTNTEFTQGSETRRRFKVTVDQDGSISQAFADGIFTGEVLEPYKDGRMSVLGANGLTDIPQEQLPSIAVFRIIEDMQYPNLSGKVIFLQTRQTENGGFVPWEISPSC